MQTDAPMSRGRETGQNGPPKVRKKKRGRAPFQVSVFIYTVGCSSCVFLKTDL